MKSSKLLTKKNKHTALPSRASMTTIAEATGISKLILRLAKKRNFPGFDSAGGINWKILGPEIEKRFNELTEALKTDIIGLDARIQQCNLRLRELEIQRLEGRFISMDDGKRIMVETAVELSGVIKREMSELPPRIVGRDSAAIHKEFDRTLTAVADVFRRAQAKVDELTRND
jgi:hypothetical protein